MSENSTTVRYSASEVRKLRAAGQDRTSTNAPEAQDDLPPHFWENAKIVMPQGKTSVHLRLDSEVVEWFRAAGKGHLTRMNAVLKSYMLNQTNKQRQKSA
jgi:uncharacterized protein (DUF4415 family)